MYDDFSLYHDKLVMLSITTRLTSIAFISSNFFNDSSTSMKSYDCLTSILFSNLLYEFSLFI